MFQQTSEGSRAFEEVRHSPILTTSSFPFYSVAMHCVILSQQFTDMLFKVKDPVKDEICGFINKPADGDSDRTSENSQGERIFVPSVIQLQRDPDSVSRSHKLIILNNPPPDHKAWEATLGSFEETGSLHFTSGSRDKPTHISIPPCAADTKTDVNVEVRVSIQGIKLNPSIRAEIFIYRGDGFTRQRIYTAYVDWPFNLIQHHGGIIKGPVRNLSARLDSSSRHMELAFDTQCAVSSNLLPVTYDTALLRLTDDAFLNKHELSLLKDLADMVEHPRGRRILVRFDISSQDAAKLAAGDVQAPHSRLLDSLPTTSNLESRSDGFRNEFSGPRWSFYRKDVEKLFTDSGRTSPNYDEECGSGELICESSSLSSDSTNKFDDSTNVTPLQVLFDQMKSRHAILRRPHPGTPIKGQMIFSDQDDALVSLAYGAYLEYVEQEATFNAVSRNAHFVRLCTIDTRVLALVDFSSLPQTGLPDDRFRLDDRTKVKLTIGNHCMEPEKRNCILTEGLIVANVFNLPRCDMLVLISNKWASTFKGMAEPIEALRQDDGQNARRHLARVSPMLFKVPYKAEVEAVIRAYGTGCPKERLPFLLSDGQQLENMCPVSRVSTYSKLNPAFEHLQKAKPWNKQQLQAINTIRTAPGGSMIVTGPGGTGKTELIVHLIEFAVSCGQYAIVSGTRNDTLDDMTIKIRKINPTIRPVRFYAPSQEGLGSLYTGNVGHTPTLSANGLLVATFDAIEHDTKKSRRFLPEFSVLSRVLENLARGPMFRQFRAIERGGPRGKKVDVRAYLRERLPLLQKHLYSVHLPWVNGDEEKEYLFQCYKFLREEVITEATVILCTNVIAGNPELCYNFAFKKDVWVFQDEAQSMTEAAALIPLGLNNPSDPSESTRKVVMHFLSGDLKQLPPFSMCRTGRFNTVNEFGPQRNISLMERKLNSSYPAINLVEQRRAAEPLMRGANMFHYGGKLVTPSYPSLDPQVIGLIPAIAGFKIFPHHKNNKCRVAWMKTDSPVYENQYTGSRANPGNAAFVRKCLFKVRDTFGKTTNAKVMLATPYKRQKELYLSMACELKATHDWKDSEIPRIVTIDSLIGREASLVILDIVNTGTEGFLRDVRRACVAFTRGKDQFMVVGGSFHLPTGDKLIDPKILKDPVTGISIPADMSRPLVFYHDWYKANKFMYNADMSGILSSDMPVDLRPLGQDYDDEKIGEDFAKEEEYLQKLKDQEGWEFV